VNIDSSNNFITFGDEKSMIVNISAKSLKRIYELYYYRGLFAQNLRYYVKNAKVDANIVESIQSFPDNFWYYNNGIILICDDYIIQDNSILLSNFSIINGGQTTKLIGETDGLSFVDSELEHNRAFSYTYSVRPIYEDECYGSFKSVLAQWGMNVNENSHNTNVNIYPNPADDKVYIETQVQTVNIEIYDIYGRVQNLRISESQNLRISIDVANLKSGIYFIKINTNEGNIVKRIIKQ
jgi:hypothetical protein